MGVARPCPFCGGIASADGVIKYSNDADVSRLNGQSAFYFVNCIVCGATNKGLMGFKTRADAIIAWNRRATDALLVRVEQALEHPWDTNGALVAIRKHREEVGG